MTFSSTIRSLQSGIPLVLLTTVLAILSAGRARGQWVADGTPACVATGAQSGVAAVGDGVGGLIACWVDERDGNSDIYVQRINAYGVSLWTANGVGVCTATGVQRDPVIISAGPGGAIIAWSDERTGALADDIYSQQFDGDGSPLWQADGVLVCAAANEQSRPVLVGTGMGAIVVWEDERLGFGDARVFAQAVDGSGNTLWVADGIALAVANAWQGQVQAVEDPTGGAIVVWTDFRSGGGDGDLYAQRVGPDGSLLWGTLGAPVCTYPTQPADCRAIADGMGGMLVAWVDRFGTSFEKSDVYVQHVDQDGVIQWASRGVPLSDTPSVDQTSVSVTADGVGGTIAVWTDWGGNGLDPFAQRLDASGNPLWTPNGIPICNDAGDQHSPTIVADGTGGAIVAWQDDAPGIAQSNVRAGRVDPSGTLLWGASGVNVSSAANRQQQPLVTSDGGGGAAVVWTDRRDEATTDRDIYALRVGPGGAMPTGIHSRDRTPTLLVTLAKPNPFSGGTRFDVVLETEASIDVVVYDVLGRQVRRELLDAGPAGTRTIEFDGRDDDGRPLPGGVYFCRVTAGGSSAVLKLTIAR